MVFFVYLKGDFECVRCGRISTASIQTKLLRHEYDNSCVEYGVGDAEEIVGLDDYYTLHAWDAGSPLVVAIGHWDCRHCHLNWQWARAVFDLMRPELGDTIATVRELSGLQPWQAADLMGVHFVEPDLAELSGFHVSQPMYKEEVRLERWRACTTQDRCELVAAGYREWCREVAGVTRTF